MEPGAIRRPGRAHASGLNFPNGMALLPDGSLLVATSRPVDTADPSYFASTAELVRLVNGSKTITVTIADSAGASGAGTRTVNVQNAVPPASP